MPAYHSAFNEDLSVKTVGNLALLPIRSKIKGPASNLDDPNIEDIIDEAIGLYRANCLFRNYEIKGHADRVLIYLTLYIQECIVKLATKMPSSIEASKMLATHAVTSFPLPGDSNFPLNAMYEKPASRPDADLMKAYLTQLRQEVSVRLPIRMFEDDKPSKWWMCFSKRKFMGLNGVGTTN